MTGSSNPPATLTREEVSCLKTALALVVIKRRLQARREQQEATDRAMDATTTAEQQPQNEPRQNESLSLCPWLHMDKSASSASPCTPQHLDSMLQLAINTNDTTLSSAIATHIRIQLLSHLDDILLQQWLRRQVSGLMTAAAARVWGLIVSHETAVELAVRVLEELTPVVQDVLHGSSSHNNNESTVETYGYYHLTDACVTSLATAGSVDVIQDWMQSLAEFALPVPLSQAYVESSFRMSIVWLRMELQQLLMKAMQHVGDGGYHRGM